MKRKLSNLIKIMGVSIIAISMVACGGKNGITSEDFAINSSKIESDDGNYNITLEFYEKAGTANYIIYENDKEIKNNKKDEKGKENKEFIFTDKANGEYVYKVSVEDNNNETSYKDVKVKVKNNKVTEVNPEQSNEREDPKDIVEGSNEIMWDKESIEYKVNDKVSYKGRSYECLQSHTSQVSWTPLDAPSLWKVKG